MAKNKIPLQLGQWVDESLEVHAHTHTDKWQKQSHGGHQWRQVTVWSLKDRMNIKPSPYGAKRPAGPLVMSSQMVRKRGGDNEEREEENKEEWAWGLDVTSAKFRLNI